MFVDLNKEDKINGTPYEFMYADESGYDYYGNFKKIAFDVDLSSEIEYITGNNNVKPNLLIINKKPKD